MFNRPLVHKGFLTSWLAGGFNDKVVSRTMEHVNKSKSDPDKLKIYITGKPDGCTPLGAPCACFILVLCHVFTAYLDCFTF